MLDMHNHYLPYVDDGFPSLDASFACLKEAYENGVDRFLFTPHFYHHKYAPSLENILTSYEALTSKAKEAKMDAKFYLGREICYSPYIDVLEMLDKKELQTLGNTNWVLLEFSAAHRPDEPLEEIAYRFSIHGYRLIIAHVERYPWLKWNELALLRAEGALLQVNADSLMGDEGFRIARFARKAVKAGLVSFIASDMHIFRHNRLKEAMAKYGGYLLSSTLEEDLEKARSLK